MGCLVRNFVAEGDTCGYNLKEIGTNLAAYAKSIRSRRLVGYHNVLHHTIITPGWAAGSRTQADLLAIGNYGFSVAAKAALRATRKIFEKVGALDSGDVSRYYFLHLSLSRWRCNSRLAVITTAQTIQGC
jgi:hypothetical protein